MLDRAKLAKELAQLSDALFVDRSSEYERARALWELISADEHLVAKIKDIHMPRPLPTWSGSISSRYPITSLTSPYSILGVDGSQIYPDRHQGMSCFLINIGSVLLTYDTHPRVQFDSIPYVFTGSDDDFMQGSADIINCKRLELELQFGFATSRSLPTLNNPLLVLFDGSLIFWHLDQKEPITKDTFLPRYLALLYQFAQAKQCMASYISLPKSKELVNIVRLAACDFDVAQIDAVQGLDHIVDAQVVSFFLQPHERTIVFQNNAQISQLYPDQVRPHFFYLHTGEEVGRVEIPAWIAQDENLVNLIAQIILDQCIKGRGYPVALAEAHEQAVVKGPDRDFFYHLLTRIGLAYKQSRQMSQKIIKKRGIGI